MKDLYAPTHYLATAQRVPNGEEWFAAIVRCCSLLREELFFCDRMIVQSNIAFTAWTSDPEIRSLFNSEIISIGSTEAWPDERGDPDLTGLYGTAKILSKYQLTVNPRAHSRRLRDPSYREFLRELDRLKPMEPSPIFLRDEIFTNLLEDSLLLPDSDLLRKLCDVSDRPISRIDKRFLIDELRLLFDRCKAIAATQNIDSRKVLGIIHFYPEFHPRAAEVGSLFYLLKKGDDTPYLREFFRDKKICARFLQWIDANYVSAEASSFGRGVILSEDFREDESVISGTSLDPPESFESKVHEIPIDSIMLTPRNICLLTANDIFDVRESPQGKKYFACLRSRHAELSTDEIVETVETYLMTIIERIRLKYRKSPIGDNTTLLISTVRDSQRFLTKAESFLSDKAVSSTISAVLSVIGIPNVLQLAVRGTSKAAARIAERRAIHGELVLPSDSGLVTSFLRLHSSKADAHGIRRSSNRSIT